MKNRWLWAFTGTLHVPNEGAYIQDDPIIKDGVFSIDKSNLVQKLEQNDQSVRFVPFGFNIESMSSLELAKNPYVIGLAGEEGADKLAQVADKFKGNPYLWSFKSVSEPLAGVSALDSSWDVVLRLDVSGDDHGYDRNGYGFGVRVVK